MIDVVTMGEAMIRLSPSHFKRLEQTTELEVYVGGGELNVAVAVSRLGLKSRWISKLPDNPLGWMIRNKAREQGVDTNFIAWEKNGRAGLYFMEFGASPRASKVLYDRFNSSASKMRADEFKWDEIFKGVKWFHISGITPALSESAAEATMSALKAAKKEGCMVSYDLNYRAKLWSEEEAQKIQEPMMEYVDVLISTEEDTARVFKIKADTSSDFKEVKEETYMSVAEQLINKFNFKIVAITLRENISVWKNRWGAMAYDGNKFYTDIKREVEIVDRVGGGDSFSGGFIFGYLEKNGDIDYALKFGNAFSSIKHSVPGDLNWCTKEEVEAILKGNSLRVQR